MALGLDGSASATTTNASSVAATLTTASAGDLIIVAVGQETTSPAQASSVTATGLTFTHRKFVVNGTVAIDEWWAVATGTFSGSITANLAAATDAVTIIAFGISGADTVTKWDSNFAVSPTTNTGSGFGTSLAITTANANDFVFSLVAFDSSSGFAGTGTFTVIKAIVSAGFNGHAVDTGANYIIVSAAGTNTASWTENSNVVFAIIGDAVIQASGAAAPKGSPLELMGVG